MTIYKQELVDISDNKRVHIKTKTLKKYIFTNTWNTTSIVRWYLL